MMSAAAMGATAFQKGLGGIHALSHPVGAIYNTHHGMTNAVFMPYVLAFNDKAIADRMARLSMWLGLEDAQHGRRHRLGLAPARRGGRSSYAGGSQDRRRADRGNRRGGRSRSDRGRQSGQVRSRGRQTGFRGGARRQALIRLRSEAVDGATGSSRLGRHTALLGRARVACSPRRRTDQRQLCRRRRRQALCRARRRRYSGAQYRSDDGSRREPRGSRRRRFAARALCGFRRAGHRLRRWTNPDARRTFARRKTGRGSSI